MSEGDSSERDRYQARIFELAERARERRESIDPDPPDDERATEIAREGVGPTVSLYCEARTGGTMVDFEPTAFEALETALTDWLACYAACYGADVERDATIREAAELLIDTHDAVDVAAVLTGVPDRH
jgi:hypothetical protein